MLRAYLEAGHTMKFRIGKLALAGLAMTLGSSAIADPGTENARVAQEHAAPPPGAAHTTFDIVANRFGRKIRGSAGTDIIFADGSNYIATFPVDVTNCVYVATLGRATTDGGTNESPGFITVVRSAGFTNGVFLQTYGVRNKLRSLAFHLLVAC